MAAVDADEVEGGRDHDAGQDFEDPIDRHGADRARIGEGVEHDQRDGEPQKHEGVGIAARRLEIDRDARHQGDDDDERRHAEPGPLDEPVGDEAAADGAEHALDAAPQRRMGIVLEDTHHADARPGGILEAEEVRDRHRQQDAERRAGGGAGMLVRQPHGSDRGAERHQIARKHRQCRPQVRHVRPWSR